jgi:hypothetical protein
MRRDTTTVYLTPGATAQKPTYHTDPEDCQSMPADVDVDDLQSMTKREAEDVRDLELCTWCGGGIDQSDHDQTYNTILKNTPPEEGWDGVRERIKEVRGV